MKLPAPLRWIRDGWMAFSHLLGLIMSKIILTIVWLTLFTIYGVIRKITDLFSSEKWQESYWVDPPAEAPDALRHQF
ncbi:MAG: hypothetical protein PHH13_02215 [Candidatus Peribacteraceae bacterium]|nr:hypothetical protein [Candidatus Peribacteraceae bacterium]